jgi:hypothetical protein
MVVFASQSVREGTGQNLDKSSFACPEHAALAFKWFRKAYGFAISMLDCPLPVGVLVLPNGAQGGHDFFNGL